MPRKGISNMDLNEFMKVAGLELDVRWTEGLRLFQVDFKCVDVADGHCVVSKWGGGRTRRNAIEDYCSQVQGQILVQHALCPEETRRIPAPSKLEYAPEEWEIGNEK